MATGITSKKKSTIVPQDVTLAYDGKKAEKEILSLQYKQYTSICSINGNGENELFYGDNLDVMLFMLNNGYKGRVSLIYIDPPYSTSFDFVNRDLKIAYTDSLRGGAFVEFLRERLILMRELLASDGSIYLHLDGNMAFRIKIIMDEIFGENNCLAFITRKKCSTKNSTSKTYGNVSDYIMFYSKTKKHIWNRPYEPWDDAKLVEQYPYLDEASGRRYKKVPIHAPGVRKGETGKEWRGMMPPKGKHWQYTPDKLDELDAAGEIYWSPNGNPRRIVYCDGSKGIPVQDIWLTFRDSINQATKTTGYPTEKNYDMLKMIVNASSNEGDIVMDAFCGSGTTMGAAFELNRKWIGIDNSQESLKAVLMRFTGGLKRYGDYVNTNKIIEQTIDFGENCCFTIFSSEDDKNLVEQIIKENGTNYNTDKGI